MKNQQGFLTILTVTLIVVMSFLAISMAYVFSSNTSSVSNFQAANRAFYLAESGLEQATRALLLPSIATRSSCAGLNISNSAVSGGTFTTTATGPFAAPSPPTTLSGALTNSATTIPVVSTTNYQSSGRIMIDRELINYTATNSTNFLNATRGVDNTTATTHVSGTTVGQYQCQLSASGGSPTLTPANPGDPGGIRILTEVIQLQEAWVAGNKPGANNFTFIHWNNPTEVAWSNASFASASSVNLNGISMLSYDDGWAVGANRTFVRWNGSTWTPQTPAAIPNVTMNSVYCNAANDCHAVGQNSGGALFARWDGASWTRIIPSNSSNNNLNSVYCDASNDCWAVGNNTGNKFYQWNGSGWAGIVVGALSGFNFNGVFCNSSTDCWAVGADNVFGRKNGASWADATVTERGSIPSVQYNSVYCVASSDCWAVGNTNASNNLFVHWNGTSWARDPSTPSPKVNLNGVACMDTNDCWAVGASSGGQGTFFHWDGTSWTNVVVSGMPNVALNAVAVIGPNSQPWSMWSENFS
jgi:Tfp pilus assembly protein PilX